MTRSFGETVRAIIKPALMQNNAQVAQEALPYSPNPIPPVSYASPQDVYENEVGYISPFSHFAVGNRRPRWAIPDLALTHTPVSSLLTSGTPTNTQNNQIIGGLISGVKAPSSGWAPMPNMQIQVVANGPVHIVTNFSIQSTVASDLVSFAFYRDGNQFGQVFTHTTSSAVSSPTLLGLSIIDSPTVIHSFLNPHIYSLYWKAGSGTLSTASTAQRSMYGINLTPQ